MTTLEIIKTMAEYYGKEMSAGQVRMYNDTLKDLSPLWLDMALKQYIKEGSPFMPKVAELRRMEAQVRSSNRDKDVLQLIPGAAQTEADLDARYGTIEEHRAICDVFTSGGELSDSQRALLGMGAHD